MNSLYAMRNQPSLSDSETQAAVCFVKLCVIERVVQRRTRSWSEVNPVVKNGVMEIWALRCHRDKYTATLIGVNHPDDNAWWIGYATCVNNCGRQREAPRADRLDLARPPRNDDRYGAMACRRDGTV